jgi:hypothetical protein
MKVREIIDGPGAWTTGAYAVDGKGVACNPWDPMATSWCVVGAAQAAYDDEKQYVDALQRLASAAGITVPDNLPTPAEVEEFFRNSLVRWNDTPGRTFDEVRELIERADV